jgi:hypothetical protein
MIDIPSRIEPSLRVSFSLSSILAYAAASQHRPVFAGPSRASALSWAPCLVMLLLAVASCIFGILHPDIFTAVGRDAIVSP